MSFTVQWIDRNRSMQKRECASAIEALKLSYGRPTVVVKDSSGARVSEQELHALANEKAAHAPRP
jgi:hypothetical protein